MRIHLPLHPRHFEAPSTGGPSQPHVYQLGGDLVLIELQGELNWEGDKSNGVVGVIGLERPDKPTLHLGEHHLLHGKFVNLQKPYAVIRKATAPVDGDVGGTKLDGDLSEEEDLEVDTITPSKKRKPGETPQKKADGEEEEEEEGPLFAPEPDIFPTTPAGKGTLDSSSPFFPSSSIKDYSSELDPSSPVRWEGEEDEDEEEAEERAKQAEIKKRKEQARQKRKAETADRTRHYEVVGIVRKKVVFALRPEPIVTATVLPE